MINPPIQTRAELRDAVMFRPYFRPAKALIDPLAQMLSALWTQVRVVDAKTGEETIYLKHAGRCEVVRRAMDRRALSRGERQYMRRAFGIGWLWRL